MTYKTRFNFTHNTILALAFTLLLPSSGIAAVDDTKNKQRSEVIRPLGAKPAHSKTALNVIKMLDKHHYLDIDFDDDAAEDILDQYIESLDPSRSHFRASDIKSFKRQQKKLDDDLRRGQLKLAFTVYNRFHERRMERFDYLLKDIEGKIKSLDFTREENILIDRENAPWASNKSESLDLWRKLLKNDVLNLVLSEEPQEKIIEKLEKRYTNQKHQLEQINADDVFSYFMTAVTHTYDPHTDYMPPRDSENFEIHMRLSLEGIGAMLQREEEYIKIHKLIAGGPAHKSKQIKPSARIVAVGQGDKGEMVDVVGWRLDEVVDLIRGPKGTVVKLTLIPANSSDESKTKIVTLVRDTINLEEQSAQKEIIEIERNDRTYKVGIIELPTFYADFRAYWSRDPNLRKSSRDVERLINELKDENIDALILDLRNNGGGSLTEANDLTGLFIPRGPTVQTRNANGLTRLEYDKNPKVAYNGPLAVLVNRLSASASEILAGAIQDYGRGIVIGGQTFGKGTVQSITPLEPDPGQLKFTQSKFYRVSGDSTQSRGVIPDIHFPVLFDTEEIGENALPNALNWDQIRPASFDKVASLKSILPKLQHQHLERISKHPDFAFLHERVEFLTETRDKDYLSLNEAERKKERSDSEQRLLNMENKRRLAKNLPVLKTYEEYEEQQEDEDEGVIGHVDEEDSDAAQGNEELAKADEIDKPSDSLLKEAGHILLDWRKLEAKKFAAH